MWNSIRNVLTSIEASTRISFQERNSCFYSSRRSNGLAACKISNIEPPPRIVGPPMLSFLKPSAAPLVETKARNCVLSSNSKILALFLLSASLPPSSRCVFSHLHRHQRSVTTSPSRDITYIAAKSRLLIGVAAFTTRLISATTTTAVRSSSQQFCAMADRDFSSRSVDQARLYRQ